MNQQRQDFEKAGIPPDQSGAFVDAFFDQLEPKPKKGRPWTFDRLNTACDTPDSEPVQAVLYPDDEAGFTLYARQGRTLHAVTYDGRPVRFRTFEKALTTLADVAHLSPEIIVDSSNWRETAGPM
ncbi:hypothetical protein ACSEUI_29510 [Pseudomonas aeruginosa]|nr:hypothetical protein [Salmonella enterica subsp. enterica serovar Agona]